MYKRVLIKISGEALAGEKRFGFDEDVLSQLVNQIKSIHDKQIQIALVIGGGNFWRGREGGAMDSVKADQMGMLATVMNGICVCDALKRANIPATVLTPYNMLPFAEHYSKEKAVEALTQGTVVIFSGGTGNPFFSTDTAATLRGLEIEADILLFAKNVDGVYDCDPKTNPEAKKYEKLSFKQVIEKDLKVMDLTAAAMCLSNALPLLVFAMEGDNIQKAVAGEKVGTLVYI